MHPALTGHHRRIRTMDATATAADVHLSPLVEAYSNTPYDITSPQQPDKPTSLCLSGNICVQVSLCEERKRCTQTPAQAACSYMRATGFEPDARLSMNILKLDT